VQVSISISLWQTLQNLQKQLFNFIRTYSRFFALPRAIRWERGCETD